MNVQVTHIAIQQRMAQGVGPGRASESTVRRLWWAALEILQGEILLPPPSKGVWLAAPLPALYEPNLLNSMQGWVWAPDELKNLHSSQGSLLPPPRIRSKTAENQSISGTYKRLPLRKDDGHDPLLIIITPEVQVALALEGQPGKRNLLMRSDQETMSDLLSMLDLRLKNEDPSQAHELRKALADLGQLKSHESLDKIFWPLLSERLADMAPSVTLQPILEKPKTSKEINKQNSEITLLEALTHEVRTPLATIRTFIRSLVRRDDLPEIVLQRLKEIDSECTEQIDRFGLIFNAAELHRQPHDTTRLASTDLGGMLELLSPGWISQLERRGLELVLDITPDLPKVLSDSERLEPILGGLIDRISRGLPSGGRLLLLLRPAGPRLKLQMLDQAHLNKSSSGGPPTNFEMEQLGPVLSWNPTTGSLQLSQAATQQMLASLGGRLTQRRDSGITVFFPIADVK